ncbi:hypothetical protein [Anaerorhabdus furcosa]|uniref:Uncharacterized protein n=1 Tax=Anaerorhabdus furcosa TaxID=118967 RepID=A0A1T4NGS2_9FIRM|nr:hypothetical protein [Anaerorhabdus furcosa]SJZ78266.1 hypothetical protein SAMN02745191_1619 [Anaerorhabdus furcosa]
MKEFNGIEELEMFQVEDEVKEYSSLTELLNDNSNKKSMENQTFNSLSSLFSARRSF